MLDIETKNRINTARDILVGKVPDPKSQVEQITIALIYKFMDDMDLESEELGGKKTFFVDGYSKYSWRKIFDPRLSGYELLNMYGEAITKMDTNPGVPKLFRDIFKNAYLPYRDPETLKSFLKVINEFEYTHSEKLGDAFEYLLSVLGSQGDAGQFRTPRHIIDFMVAIIDPQKNETILDPACGTSGFLISSYRHIIKHNSSNFDPDKDGHALESQGVNDRIINSNGYTGDLLSAADRRRLADNIYGYDISPDMVRLSLVNMYLHGIKEPHISEYDTLTNEDHWNHFSDVILANPPFMSPKGGIRPHKRFSVQSNRSEVLFVDYIAEHLTSNGRAAVIVPEGIIFQSGNAYKQLRKMLVEEYLVGVISLPAGIFQPYSGVKTSILWLDKALAKKTDKILFVKINNDGYDLGSQRKVIKQNDIPKALEQIFTTKQSLQSGKVNELKDLNLVSRDTILNNSDCSLSGDRYLEKVSISSEYDLMQCGSLMRRHVRMFDPRTDPNAKYELWSIPAFDQGRPEIVKGESIGSAKKMLIPGDVLLSRIVPHIRRSWVVKENGTNFTKLGSTEWIIFNSDKLNPDFLKWILQSDIFHEQFMKTVTGVGGSLSRASINAVEEIKIPVPTLAVQDSIAAELNSFHKIVDGARMVVENYKPRIEIDPEWEMVALEEVCHHITKGTTPTTYGYKFQETGVNFIKIENINLDGSIKKEGLSHITSECHEALKRSQLCENDIVFSIAGTKMGITGIVDKSVLPANTNQALAIIRSKGQYLPPFLMHYLMSENIQVEIEKLKVGVAQFNLSLQQVSKLLIPRIDLHKQKELVSKIEIERCLVDANKQLIRIFEQKIKDRIAKVWGE